MQDTQHCFLTKQATIGVKFRHLRGYKLTLKTEHLEVEWHVSKRPITNDGNAFTQDSGTTPT